jgi:hypothetical protein
MYSPANEAKALAKTPAAHWERVDEVVAHAAL